MPGLEKKTKKNNNVSIIFKVVPLYQTLSSVEGTCFEVYEENKSNHIITYRAVPSAASVIFTYRRNAAFMVQIWGVYYFFIIIIDCPSNSKLTKIKSKPTIIPIYSLGNTLNYGNQRHIHFEIESSPNLETF